MQAENGDKKKSEQSIFIKIISALPMGEQRQQQKEDYIITLLILFFGFCFFP